MKRKKIFGLLASASMTIALMMPVSVSAATEAPKIVGNSLYLNGNDAVINKDINNEYGAIVVSNNTEYKITNVVKDNEIKEFSYVYAGSDKYSDTEKNIFETVNITMNDGYVSYIIGSNQKKGTIQTSNITINGGKVGMVHGGARENPKANGTDFSLCKENQVLNTNIIMNNGTVGALVPGTFNLTYVQNANVTVNGGTLTAETSPTQTGILSGTNGRIDNLSINVTGGDINGISLGQRTMITGKAVMNITGGDIGDIYAGSYYADGETKNGSIANGKDWWKVNSADDTRDINYGQANNIEINVGKDVVYNNIYGGFQYHEDKKILDEKNLYPFRLMDVEAIKSLVNKSNTAPLVMNLSSVPTKKIAQKYAKEVMDSKESFIETNWLVTSVDLNESTATLDEGKTIDLKATVNPTNATDKTVTWTSSNTKVATVDATGKVTAIAEGTATITAAAGGKAATCIVTVNKVKKPTVEVPTIDTTTPPKEVTVGVQDKASQEVVADTVSSILGNITSGKEVSKEVMSEKTLQAVKTALAEGKEVTPKVEAKTIDVKTVDKTIVNKVNELVEKFSKVNETKATVAQYLDLGVLLMADAKELGTVNQLDKAIEFTVALPTDLVKEGRVFYVVRIHNGVAEKLTTTMNEDGTLTFETDKFSTYAIVYEEGTTTEKTPGKGDTVKTSDNNQTMLYASFGALAIVSAGLVLMLKKREELSK